MSTSPEKATVDISEADDAVGKDGKWRLGLSPLALVLVSLSEALVPLPLTCNVSMQYL
ncbi:MAG: hypothetical protein HEQ35_05665 [Gloeotrichia echinulata IR180]